MAYGYICQEIQRGLKKELLRERLKEFMLRRKTFGTIYEVREEYVMKYSSLKNEYHLLGLLIKIP